MGDLVTKEFDIQVRDFGAHVQTVKQQPIGSIMASTLKRYAKDPHYVGHLTITISDQGPHSGYDNDVARGHRLHDIFVSDEHDELITCIYPRYTYINPVVKALAFTYCDLGYAVSIVDCRPQGRLTNPHQEGE